MTKISPTARVMMWAMSLLAVLLIVLASLGMMTVNHAVGWLAVTVGLATMLSSFLGILHPRWAQAVWGCGSVILGLSRFLESMVLFAVGSLIGLVGVFGSISGRDTTPELPLELTEDTRSKAGLPAKTEEQGPALQVVLVDTGTKRRRVVRCLRELYGPIGLQRVFSIVDRPPTVLQTTTSRREADFASAQLAGCGAQVDIVEAQDSDDVGEDETAHP